MIFIAVCVIAVCLGAVLVYQARLRGWPRNPYLQTSIRLGVMIAAVRLVLLWAGLLLWASSNWRQILGYWLLTVNAVFELLLVREWRHDRVEWVVALSLLVAGTSLLLAFGWAGLKRLSGAQR
jgi:hypothetical protein